jgi:mono/diheme cytochrome c family protein
VDAKWLYSWVRNPKHYWGESRMPSLRLEDQEAADMVAYLMTLKNAEFDAMPTPAVKLSAVSAMALEHLNSQHGTVLGKQKFDAMSEEEKILYVGERAIQNYGCAGCHNIPGFEKAGKIGVELSDIGSRNVHTFDFGNVHIDHTKQGWIKTKLLNPRIYDEGKVKSRLEKLKMPHFNFTDEEADALVTFLMGLKKSEVAVEMTQQLDERERAIEQGRRLVRDFNCQGCHQMENLGGDIAQILPQGMNPPPLIGQGEKVWGDWLHSFLKNPSTVRHWLQVRMPTYEFTDAQADTLVKYFKALDKQDFSYNAKETQIPKPTQEEWNAGKEIFDTFRCLQCHEAENFAGRNPADLAPDLKLARNRLQPRWVIRWLVDPQKYYPGTRMPGYWPDLQSPLPNLLGGDAKKQITALRNYLLNMDLYAEPQATKPAADAPLPEAPFKTPSAEEKN